MMVPHGQNVIPRWFRGSALWSRRNSMISISGSSWWCLMVRT